MTMRKYSLPKRIIAMVLSLVMVLSVMPAIGLFAAANAAGAGSGIIGIDADPHTLDSWKDAFLPNGVISTEHAGGIWTDKSVLTSGNIAAAFPGVSGLNVGSNNFLVALSALAANSVVVGQGATPTDTVFVLDISGSMSATELNAMVRAANDAIATLLANEDNRVGIILYSTSAHVLLPLGRYTSLRDDNGTVNNPNDDYDKYIETELTSSGSNAYGSIMTARNMTGTEERPVWVEGHYERQRVNGRWEYVWVDGHYETEEVEVYEYIQSVAADSTKTDVDTSVSVSGGTYIQGGLWAGWQQFNNASLDAGETRTPVMVLMSDGAPTYLTNDFNAVPNSSEYGTGNTSNAGDGFVTQLTAAYIKEKMAEKYSVGSFEATAYFYTLGLGVDSVTNSEIAKAVLDPVASQYGAITAYWNSFYALSAGRTMSVTLGNSGGYFGNNTTNVNVRYDATVDFENADEYVNKYFPASDASQLSAAFRGIVNEISLNAGYYVTRLEGTNANDSGYITFVDEIGTGMQVKDIKGILIGTTLYTGERLAKALIEGAFGTESAATELGDNMVWALKQRLRITDTQTARALLNAAYAAGQLSCTVDPRGNVTAYSNYIGWFGDASGNYVGFWDAENPNAVIPENAVYANKCYGMLGSTTDGQTTHASDLMYVAVQVSKPVTEIAGEKVIEAKSPETVTFRIPASLLPLITYQIDVEAENVDAVDENTNVTVTYEGANPIRLLYEVGVHSELNALNIQDFLRENYQAKNDDGDYYLYTNAWYWEGSDNVNWKDESTHPTSGDDVLRDTAKNHITYAYFEPGEDNEHYYFNTDTTVYYLDGSTYKPVPVSAELDTTGNTKYYFKHISYTTTESGNQDRSAVDIHYSLIDNGVITNHAVKNGSKWYIPAGTMHYATIHDHNEDKAQNKTESFFARLHQLVDIAVEGDTSHHYEIVYMGNNGRITYAPYQGIKLSKVMNDGSQPNASFDFTIALTPADGETLATAYDTIHVAADGTETTGSAAVNAGKITVSLKPGESIYILNIATGTGYSITEGTQHDYTQHSATNTNGTIAENVITESVFTNMVQEYGALTVTKVVTYLDNTEATAAAANNKFPVTVTLTRDGAPFTGTVFVNSVSTAVTDGTITFEIADGQSVILSDIPVGVTYVVDEGALPDRYTQTNAADPAGTIDADGENAVLTNQYDPDGVTINTTYPAISIDVHKDLRNAAGADIDWPAGAAFTFELLRYVPATDTEAAKWESTGKSVTLDYDDYAAAKGSGTEVVKVVSTELSLDGISFDRAGDYLFRLSEVDAGALGMTYDTTDHDFRVIVTDADLDGVLEISRVEVIDPETGLEQDVTGNWEIGATYINVYQVGTASLTLETGKTLAGREMKDGEFRFTLTGLNGAPMPVGVTETSVTMPNGKLGHVVFPAIVYTDDDIGNTYKYTIEEVDGGLAGVSYDKSRYEVTVVVGSDIDNDLVTTEVTYKRIANAEGNEVDETVTAEEVRFANTYAAASTKVTLSGTKRLTGKNIADGMFNFVLTPVTVDAPMPASGTVSNTGNSFAFGEIEFTAAGTYQYTVSEEKGGTTVNGMTYDGKVYNVTVTVTDNGAGQLLAVTTIDGVETTSVSFSNRYDAADATVTLSGTKVVRNDTPNSVTAISPNGYRFELKQGNTVVDTAVSGANGSFTFDALTFDAEGTYTYTVSEVAGNVPGVNYNAPSWTVTIQVRDNNGTLEASINNGTYSNTASANNSFINTYKAKDVGVNLAALKVLEGRTMWENEFDFTLKAKDNAPMPMGAAGGELTVSNQANGAVVFGNITYDTVGEYVYTVTEVDNALPGITYSQTVFTVTVTVTDGGIGQLSASIAYSSDVYGAVDLIQFFNRYGTEPVKVELAGNDGGLKTLEDNTSAEDNKLTVANRTFDFTLAALNGAPMPAGAVNGAITVQNKTDGTFTFGEIEYSDLGVYEYLVTEVNGGAAGMIYDDTQYKIVVTVTDDVKDGELEVAVKYYKLVTGAEPEEKTRLVFGNRYNADGATVTLGGKKVVRNDTTNSVTVISPKGYSFELKKNGVVVDSAVSGADGSFTFDPLSFGAEGTYIYTVSELTGNVPGVSYNAPEWTVTIHVRDNNGTLEASVNGGAYANAAVASNPFTNTYTAEATENITLRAQKKLDGRDLLADEFDFTLKAVNNAPMPAGAVNGELTVSNQASGAVVFGEVKYDAVGEYVYTVIEQEGTIPGITYSKAVFTVTVTVTDPGNGKLSAAVAYTSDLDGAAQEVLFTNRYGTEPVKVELAGNDGGLKTLEDNTSVEGNKLTVSNTAFEFTLTALNGAPMPAGAVNGAITVKSGTDGTFTFGQIEYSDTGVYEYLVTEVNGGAAGMTYDDTQYKVVVTVTDEVKDGEPEVAVKYYKLVTGAQPEEKTRLVFENSYEAKETFVTFIGKKTFNGGRDLKENEFSFTLTALNGAPMGITANNETVKNAASGSFTFSKITFTKEGTYVYELVEVKGSDEQVTYDTTKYTLTVTVADDNGQLKAATKIDIVDGDQDVDAYGFTNIFAPTNVTADITVQKVLENKSDETMGLGGFEFQLVGVEKPGTVTVKSDDAGAAKFTLTFGYEDIGKTFTYKLSEVNTGIERMTYDEKVYEIKVTVGQNHVTGEITLTVTRDDMTAEEAAVFTNTYAAKPPVEPVNPDGPPKTGDSFQLGGWVAMMGISAICLLAVLVIGRKDLFAK